MNRTLDFETRKFSIVKESQSAFVHSCVSVDNQKKETICIHGTKTRQKPLT